MPDEPLLPFSLRGFGLDIETEFPCPGFVSATDPAFGRPVSIVTGAVPETLADPVCARPLTWIDASGTALHRVPGIASFLVSRGHIVAAAEPGADADRLPSILCGVPLLLQVCQWGLVPLDVTCVAVDNGAVLLAGPPAIGRTTLALALALQGGRIMADGWCAIDATDPTCPLALPSFSQLSIWPDTARLLGLRSPKAERRGRHETIFCDGLFEPEPLPVHAVVMLRTVATQRAPRWLEGREAFEAVMRLARSVELTRTLVGEPARLAAMLALAGRSKVLTMPYGSELATPAAQASKLLQLLGRATQLSRNSPTGS